MNITISVDTSGLDRLLAGFPAAIARAQRVALLKIGNSVKNRTVDAFRNPLLRPSPWAPRKSGGKWPLLIKSGTLRQSIGYKLEGDDTVVIGTDKKYAGYHQTGTKHMPARPFFPVDAKGELMPDVRETIVHKVEKAFSDELRKIGIG